MKDFLLRAFTISAALVVMLAIGIQTVSAARTQVLVPTATVTNGVMYYDGTQSTNLSTFIFNPTTVALGVGSSTPWALLSVTNTLSTAANTPLFVVASSTNGTATTTAFIILPSGNIGIGTTTSSVSLSIVKQPLGNGTVASSTLQIGNISTTTSRSSIQMINTAGSPVCFYIIGSLATTTPGTCN